MLDILNIVLPTFLVILVGFVLGKVKRLDMSVVVEVLFWIGIPALAFTAMTGKQIVLLDASKVWASALMIMAGTGAVAWIVFKLARMKHSGLYVAIIVLNAVNIPFPVMSMAYGQEGLLGATLFYIPVTLIMEPLNVIGAMVIPLTLLVLGYRLSSVRINDAPATLLASVMRVGVGLGDGSAGGNGLRPQRGEPVGGHPGLGNAVGGEHVHPGDEIPE